MKLRLLAATILLLLVCGSLVASSTNSEYQDDPYKTLNESWKLVLHQYLTYNEVIKDTSAVDISVPGTWNNVLWQGQTFSGQGFGTYFTKIDLTKYKHFQNKPLAIEMPDIGLAYRIYANDRPLGEVGKIGKTKETAMAKLKTELFFIPEVDEDELIIIIQVCNFWHQSGGVWFAPKIGTIESVSASRNKENNIVVLVLGGVFIIGIYHLYLFLLRRKERYGLYFFGICFCLLAQSLTKGNIPIITFFPNIDWMVVKRLEYTSLFTVAWLNTGFIYETFDGIISKKVKRMLAVLSLAAVAFTITMSTVLSYYLILPFQLITCTTGVYLIISLTRAVISKQTGSLLLMIGLIVTFLTLVNDILNSHYIIHTFLMVHFGMLIYIITLSLVLAKRFTGAINREELLSIKLEKLNLQLEERVEKRTAQIKKQKQLLEKAHDEQKHLMAIVAHDLMSPLNKILGLSNLMKGQLKSEMARFNTMIANTSQEGRKLIENLVNLHSYERKEFEVKNKSFELNSFIQTRISEYSNQATDKEISLTTSLSSVAESLNTDPDLLGRVLDNLLSNAIKFSPSKSNINVGSQSTDTMIEISIKDEGPGFSEEDKNKAFRKFQRLSAQPTAGEHSTGLGLSIVKSLVEKMGGNIELISQLGAGSEFIIRLPKAWGDKD